MTNLNSIFRHMAEILSANENCEPKFEANQLIEFVLGKNRLELGPDFQVSEGDSEKLLFLCEKRKNGYPLQYILGTCGRRGADSTPGHRRCVPCRL